LKNIKIILNFQNNIKFLNIFNIEIILNIWYINISDALYF